MRRDPRTDPREGDVLYQAEGTRELLIDKVDSETVAYWVRIEHRCSMVAYRVTDGHWRESAPYTCDESEMFCPSCDGRGDECKIVPGGLFGKESYVPCRMCNGAGRLYLTEEKLS